MWSNDILATGNSDMDMSVPCRVHHTSVRNLSMNHSREQAAGLHAVGEADICGQSSLGTMLHNTAQPEGRTPTRPANAPHQAQMPCPTLPNTSSHDGHTDTGACLHCHAMAMLLLRQGRLADLHHTELAKLLDVLQTRLSQLDLQLQMLLNPGTAYQPTDIVQEVAELLQQHRAHCLLEADLQDQVAVLTQSLHRIGWYVIEQRAAAAGQSYM